MAQQYKVNKRGKLLPFLFEALDGWSKKSVKQRLRGSLVFVNGEIQTKHDHIVSQDDMVQIGATKTKIHHASSSQIKLEIIYQDSNLIAINKPAGLLSVGTTKESKHHALSLLRNQLAKGRESVKLWPVHRLDRDTSGILLFATSKEMREAVMSKWGVAKKIYLAIVEGTPKKESDTILEPLRLDEKEYRMHVGVHKDAKSATTHYKVKENRDKHSLVEVSIETGRQHQIRAHMAWMGNSIVGDERYGKKGGRMGLHAMSLAFIHPVTQKKIQLKIDADYDFYALLK